MLTQQARRFGETLVDRHVLSHMIDGDMPTQYVTSHLGIRYLNGDGVEKNTDTAKKWLEKAAKNGHSGARKKLQELKDEAK